MKVHAVNTHHGTSAEIPIQKDGTILMSDVIRESKKLCSCSTKCHACNQTKINLHGHTLVDDVGVEEQQED